MATICRLRLREEVDVLKHLADAASDAGIGPYHPNVLGYVDSWEEDETLYIQTELCGLGNFAHFLWEYGRDYPKLDEARVWKIFAELSSVSVVRSCSSSHALTVLARPVGSPLHSYQRCDPHGSQTREHLHHGGGSL